MFSAQGSSNHALITGQVQQLQPLRYTPAGVAVLSMELAHHSEMSHDQFRRQLSFAFEVLAVGALAQQLADVAVGTELKCQGFFAPKHKNSSFLVLHLQQFELLTTD